MLFDTSTAFSSYFLTFMKNNLQLFVPTIYFEFVLEVSILGSTESKGVGFRKYLWLYVHTPALASKLHTEQMWKNLQQTCILGPTNEKNTYSSICLIFFQNYGANGLIKCLMKDRCWGGGVLYGFGMHPILQQYFLHNHIFTWKPVKL